jgi:tripartite-type tricarboxylate transporter receptor subunit TctC
MRSLPEVPAMGELGYSGMMGDTFRGMLVPAGTPAVIVARLRADITRGLAVADMRDRLTALGFELIGNTPEQFSAQIKADIDRWGKVIREAGIKAE